jgi:opacity protein-like surface antigen
VSRISKLFLAVAVAALALAASAVAVSNAHFVGTPQINISGNTVTVSGKVAGLGDVDEITTTVTGDAACINPGSKKPQAANKESFSESGITPVQNGKALFSQSLTATFQPDCTPPMSVQWSNITVTVTADDGTFLQFP